MSKAKRNSSRNKAGHRPSPSAGNPDIVPAPSHLMQQAVAEYQQGDWNNAEARCRLLLRNPSNYSRLDNFDALNILGIIAAQASRIEDAIEFLRRASLIEPGDIAAHMNLGHLLRQNQRPEEALEYYEKAIKIQPAFPDAYYFRGLALADIGRKEPAIESYNQALALNPHHANAHNDRGIALASLDRHEAALKSFDNAIASKRDYAEAYGNRGATLMALKRYEEALENFDKAISLKIDLASAYFNRGLTLDALKRYDEALDNYDQSLRLAPENATAWMCRGIILHRKKLYAASAESYRHVISLTHRDERAHNNLGITLAALNHFDAALDSYDEAIAINPGFAEAHNNRAAALTVLKKYPAALESYEQALGLQPDYAEARKNMGMLCFALGDFQRGWPAYEYRWTPEQLRQNTLRQGKQRWQGNKSDKRLFIWAEQGIGDQILHGTILPDILDFPQHKTVSLNNKLIPLFRRSFATLEFMRKDNDVDFEAYDEQIPIGGLGQLFRASPASFEIARTPYLIPDKKLSAQLSARIKTPGKLMCGLSWSSVNSALGDDKSLSLNKALPFLSLANVVFVDLQYGDTSNERHEIKKNNGIDIVKVDDIDNFNDIDGLAALIDACDLVITISNSTAHLAGALGKKTLLLLPAGHSKLWYWYSPTGSCLWYPSVEVFEQDKPGVWDDPVASVGRYLENSIR